MFYQFKTWEWKQDCCFLPVGDIKVGVVVYGTSRMTSPLTHNNSRSHRTRWPHSHSLSHFSAVYQFSFQEPCCQQEVRYMTASKFTVNTVNTTVAFIETSLSIYLIYRVDWALCLDKGLCLVLTDLYNLLGCGSLQTGDVLVAIRAPATKLQRLLETWMVCGKLRSNWLHTFRREHLQTTTWHVVPTC